MAVDETFFKYISEQLTEMEPYESKKMFGGVGFFMEGKMFGMITGGDGEFRLKVNDTNIEQYVSRGMKALGEEKKKGKGMPYYKVPDDILSDKVELKKWCEQSIEIALTK